MRENAEIIIAAHAMRLSLVFSENTICEAALLILLVC